MRRDEDPASPRYITAYGRDVEQAESELDYDPSTRRLTISGGSRRDAKLGGSLSAVLDLLRKASTPMNGTAIKSALKDSEFKRDVIDAALAHGVSTGALAMQPGPRNSKIYRPAPKLPSVSHECPLEGASECPGAYMGPDTRTLPSAAPPRVSSPETQPTRGGDEGAYVLL